MSNDDLKLRELGQAMKEADAETDLRLEKLANGELEPAEIERLREDAKHDPVLADALELFAPLSPEYQERIVAATAKASAPAPVIVLRRASVAVAAIVAAAAAGLMLFSRVGPSDDLPSYRLELTANHEVLRGDEPARALDRTSEITIVMRPSKSVGSELDGRLFVRVADVITTVSVEPSDRRAGAVRWSIPIARIGSDLPEQFDLIAVVGRPEALPTAKDLSDARADANWRSQSISIHLAPR